VEVSTESKGWVGVALIRIAAVYLVIALVLGLAMGLRQDFSLASVHSHLGLLGWASMGLAGIVYLVLPRTGRSRLAVVHFWLHNVGLPVMLGALTVLDLLGDSRAEPVVGLGSFLVLAALTVFAVNVFRNGAGPEVAGAGPSRGV
jgi:hypothetical protein